MHDAPPAGGTGAGAAFSTVPPNMYRRPRVDHTKPGDPDAGAASDSKRRRRG